ncbi:ATP-binding protein [Desulfonema limicola]|nr:ATP-binding protein [Desulfonema limicola]
MQENRTKIGKDVIESLTLGMYEDPRIVYREYIQNAADQIDIAVDEGRFSNRTDGKIEIEICQSEKTISIYDNATGVPESKVFDTLKSIAQGIKNREKHKGFRGIGRLGGLAYCDKLIFETSYPGESTKSILTWDANKLKRIINDRNNNEEASSVIDAITDLKIIEEETDKRYFIVKMSNVSNKTLLNKENILNYLEMVAPVPYSKGFLFKDKIYTFAENIGQDIDEYNIYLNHDQIFKSYTTRIYEGENNNKKGIDEIHDLEFIEERDNNNDLIYWGWHSISNFSKQIPKINRGRGIRLRKANIQIGMDDALVKLFKEQRGSYYFFGEIFAVDIQLIPNARRDYFIENNKLLDFELLIKKQFIKLHDLYHFSSKVRSNKKKIEKHKELVKNYKIKNTESGFTSNEEKEQKLEEIDKAKDEAKKAKKQLTNLSNKIEDKDKSAEKKVFEKIVGDKETNIESFDTSDEDKQTTKFITDELTRYTRKERKLISKIFLVVDLILTPDLAENLKQKIIEDLRG